VTDLGIIPTPSHGPRPQLSVSHTSPRVLEVS